MRRGGKINGNKREKRIDVGIETTRGSETWGDTKLETFGAISRI